MTTPDREEFNRLAASHNIIPVYREIIDDTITPVSAFARLARGRYAFLLESAERGERFGRYSFLGTEPSAVLEASRNTVLVRDSDGEIINTVSGVTDPLTVVKAMLEELEPARLAGLPSFSGGAIGYLGYDAVRRYEHLPAVRSDAGAEPDMVFMLIDEMLVFDHLRHRIKVVVNARVGADLAASYDDAAARVATLAERLSGPEPRIGTLEAGLPETETCRSNMTALDYKHAVECAKEYVRAGDVLQVVLSQRLEVDCPADPFDVYRALRTINPAPYMYFLKLNGTCLAGSSPEPLVKVDGDIVMTRPIAGTKPRGATEEADTVNAKALLGDAKERAEHVMLVDLGRNDLSKVCRSGTVHVDEMMRIENCSHVMHIVSTVTGRLKKDLDAFDALRACFPAGTVSGAPKVRAMEIIDELEPDARGAYAGVVGYVGYSGDTDVCITIRTVVMRDGKAYMQAGAGIVSDSEPESEFEETRHKAGAMLAAVAMAGRSGGEAA